MRTKKRQERSLHKTSRPIVLITGADGGIGQAVTRKFAKEGYLIAMHHFKNTQNIVSLAKWCEKAGTTSAVFRADFRRKKDIEKMAAQIKKTFGRVDALVHTAAANITQDIESFSAEDFRDIVETNLIGSASLINHILPALKNSRRGRIVLFGSIVSYIGSPRRAAYAAAKSGLTGLMHSLALELAPANITVNTIVPSYIDTPAYKKYSTITLSARKRSIPLKRLGKPEEIAAVANFLCSQDAAYITGQSLHVNGGAFLT